MPLAIDLPLFLFLLLSVVPALLLASSGWSSSKIAREWKRTEGGGCRAGGSMMSGCSDMSVGHCPSSSNHHVRILEGIAMLLSRWHGLQLAIENQWGGVDSVQKSHQLIVDIFAWFSSRPKASLYIEELENLLHESMLLSFNTEIEDGSIEEVAEQLMFLHDEYMQMPCR